MDRLVGNPRMHQEAATVYQSMAHWLVGQGERPVILVDGSPVAADESIHVLRASLPVGGQGRTLYQVGSLALGLGGPSARPGPDDAVR